MPSTNLSFYMRTVSKFSLVSRELWVFFFSSPAFHPRLLAQRGILLTGAEVLASVSSSSEWSEEYSKHTVSSEVPLGNGIGAAVSYPMMSLLMPLP